MRLRTRWSNLLATIGCHQHSRSHVFLSIFSHLEGIQSDDSRQVVYDIDGDSATFGASTIDGPALHWVITDTVSEEALLSARVYTEPRLSWIIRCDRVDFPPGGVAYRHTHPGPGIRCLLFGELTVETEGHETTHGPLDAWFESGPDPVVATASASVATAFVRVMLLPAKWAGKRTIQYVDPADAQRPKRQTARVYFDEPVQL